MPYIKKENRKKFQGVLNEICDNAAPKDAGELNYFLTKIVHSYLNNHEGYQAANDVMGALEGVKLELYRKVIAPYEDDKILENGDV